MTEITSRLSTALADRYRIEREIGEGGMATVYLAEDLKHKRKVAVKVLRPELSAVLGAERFVQEITTTANLQHPNILPLFDSGEADSFLYYVMPFIEGETLREKLNRETQLGIDEAVKITTEVAEALDSAHQQGVIHRDIKPGGTGTRTRSIHAIRPGVDSVSRVIVGSPADEYAPALSPNGRWLAFVSNETGREEVFVRPFPDAERSKFRVTVNGGTEPRWSRTGRELFLRNARGEMVVHAVRSDEETFVVEQAEVLFDASEYLSDNYHVMYDVALDDQQFIMIESAEMEGGDLILAINWFEELKAKVGN